MHNATRKIENALVQKLNCMYFVARKVSVPSIEALLKKEKLESIQIYKDFSNQLNVLINKYFSNENEGKCNLLCESAHSDYGNRNRGKRTRERRHDAFVVHRFIKQRTS